MRCHGRVLREIHRLQRLIALLLPLSTLLFEFLDSLLLPFRLLDISLMLFVKLFTFFSKAAILSTKRFTASQ
jgi:hypothetical protein